MSSQGIDKYVRASFPENHLQQVKWTSVQRSHRSATTPEKLLEAIPEAAVHPSAAITPVPNIAGAYFFAGSDFAKVPMFDWATLFKEEVLGCDASKGVVVPPPPPHSPRRELKDEIDPADY